MKKIKKAKKAKVTKVRTKVLVVAPKKRGRPRKTEAAVVPKKRGRPKKAVKETKVEKLHKMAKLGKRKFKVAVEQMAMEKINKKIRRKNGMNGNSSVGEAVSTRVLDYEKQSPILAGPNKPPVGIVGTKKVIEDKMPVAPIEDRIKKRLTDNGYDWKASSFKVVEKSPTTWVVEFTDKKYGEVTSHNSIAQAKYDVEVEKKLSGKTVKMPKLSKVELNRYVKKLIARGLNPTNIKVLENTPEYFRIEFNDGDNGSLVTCGHVKGWDV